MPNSISNAYIVTFERNVRYLAQQKGSKLRAHCQVRDENSKQHNWDRVGTLAAVVKNTRATASPVNDTPWSRRQTSITTEAAGDLVENADLAEMLIDPLSAITTTLAYAMGRAIDDLIIAAATGNATDGAGGAVAFPAGQTVGDGTKAIGLAIVSAVNAQFLANNIDPEVPKVMVVGPNQVQALLNIEQATNTFYVNAKALAENGFVKSWLGFSWIYSNRLTKLSSTSISCLAFSEMAMGLHVAKDIWARVAEDPSRSFAWQVYSEFSAGAVRVEDEHLVELRVLDTAVAVP